MREVDKLKEREIVRELNPEEKRVFSQPIIEAKRGIKAVRIVLYFRRVNEVFET